MKRKAHFWLRDPKHLWKIATFGPSGSSSEAAAKYIQDILDRKLEIHLFDSFEQASTYTERHEGCALLVANAYRGSDYFYMNPKTTLLGSLYFRTPDYYICCKNKSILLKKLKQKERISIVTHRAPSSRLKDLNISSKDKGFKFNLDNIIIKYTESTSEGAASVYKNIFDCCLTNEISATKFMLNIVSPPLAIEMIWSVFMSTNYNSEENEQCLISGAS